MSAPGRSESTEHRMLHTLCRLVTGLAVPSDKRLS